MADFTNYITNNGVLIPDTSTLQTDVQQTYKNALGEDLDMSAETPQGRLIEADTLGQKGVLDIQALVANAMNPNTSFGVFLDALCAMTGTTRNYATYTQTLCTLTGVPNATVPAGSQARTNAGDVFALVSDTTLSSTGSATAYMQAVESGPVPCAVNTLTQIVTPVFGWETINNPNAATLGQEQESDTSLRARRVQNLYQGSALLDSIISAVSQVSGVVGVYGYENYTNAVETIGGSITVQPHSIYIVADGGSDEDVAQAIWLHKSLGCGYTGTVTETVTDPSTGVDYQVSFNRPTYTPIQVSITVNVPSASVYDDLEQSVINALLSWANGEVQGVQGLMLNTPVSPFEAAAAVSDQLPDLFVSNVQVGLVSGSLGTSVLPMAVNQRATLAQSNISVTIQ